MKKIIITCFLAATLLFVFVCGISAQNLDESDFEETSGFVDFDEEPAASAANDESGFLDKYSLEELNVATINPLNGSFFTTLWGNMTSDIDVRMIIHGYDLVKWNTESGLFLPDETVVSGIIVTSDDDGNQVFTIVLYPDLYYSDGTQITAWDYAFSTLLTMAPEAAAIGGEVRRPEFLLGYDEYINGEVPYLAGFRVIDDDLFSITIREDYLPFFYEMGLLSTIPYPISVIAPGVKVADDGKGVYLTNINGGDPLFTAELLEKTILDPDTGYLSHPTVTSGPYKLVSFEDGKATFETNEYYKGNEAGELPQIQKLTFESLPGDEIVPAFENGDVSLLNKLASSDVIIKAIQGMGASNGQISMANYPRTGLGFISFNAERPIVDELSVRQALSHLVDKDAFITETVGNYGLRVDGYYGIGQWMFQILSGALAYPVEEPSEDNDITDADYEKEMAEWEALTMDEIPMYDYDPDAAAILLNAAGWNLNAAGAAYQSGVDELRYKNIDGELVPLQLTLAYPTGTSAVAGLEHIAANAKEAGFGLTISPIPMEDLLAQYHAVADRQWDMFFLALNFDVMFDPSIDFIVEEGEVPLWVESGFADEELYNDTVEMRKTEPGNMLLYVQNWLKYQQRIMQTVPVLPLYSNVYFDFYPQTLQNYNIASNVAWSEAVISAYLAEVVPEEEEIDEFGGEDEFEDFEGDEFFDDGDLVEFD